MIIQGKVNDFKFADRIDKKELFIDNNDKFYPDKNEVKPLSIKESSLTSSTKCVKHAEPEKYKLTMFKNKRFKHVASHYKLNSLTS